MTHAQRLQYQREYYRTHKAEAQAYYQKNREKKKEYNWKYYRKNKFMWKEVYTPRAELKAIKKGAAECMKKKDTK